MSNTKKQCKVCNIVKIKVKIGKRKTGSIFVDGSGKEWMGNTCPSCNVIRSKANMQQLRSKDN